MASKSLGTLTLDLVAKTGSFEQGMDKAERSAKKMEGEYKRLKQAIDPAYAAQERFTKASAVLKRELDRGAISLLQYNSDLKKLETATKLASSEAVRPLGSSIQQAGYQIGDFAVQVASGQSALVAFTQQGAQLAGFFGPGGAVLGAVLAIGGAVAGYFVRSMGEGESATDALAASVERLDQVTSQNDGIQTLTNEIRELAKESELAARARIVSAMAAAEEAAKSAARGIRDAFDGAVDTVGFSDLSDFFGAKNFRQALDGIKESFELTGDEGQKAAAKIFTALQTLNTTPTIENFRALEETIAGISTTIGANNPALQSLVGNLSQYFDGARTAAERTEYLKKVLSDLSVGTSDADGAISQMVDKLRIQAETLGLNTLQMIEYNRQTDLREAAEKGATDAQIAAINASYAKIAAHERETEAQKRATEEAKKAVAEQASLQRQIDSLLSKADPLADFASSWERVQKGLATGMLDEGQAESIRKMLKDDLTLPTPKFSGSPIEIGGAFGELNKIGEAEEKLSEWYSTQLEMLERFREERADLVSVWDEKEIALKRQHDDQLASIEQARSMAQLAAAESLFGDLSGITKSFAGEQSGIYKAMFAIEKAAAIARSMVAIQTGIANAAALPFPANLGAMATVAAATGSIVGTIQGVRMEGMAHDGIDKIPQTGTWLLEKGERVTTAETSAKLDRTLSAVQRQLTSGGGRGGEMQVVINNNAPARVSTQRVQTDKGQILKILVDDLNENGPLSRTMQSNFGMSYAGR